LNETKKILSLLQEGQAALKNNLPEVMEKFMGFAGALTQEGILSKKEKDLIAVAVAVGIHCQP
jgi:alkylhydroperoxidase/carboxymuconolactone decarboxylase family protein YurZ